MNELQIKENVEMVTDTSLLGTDRNYFKLATELLKSPLIPESIRDSASVFLILKTAQLHQIDYLIALQNAYVIQGKLAFSSHFLWSRAIGHADCVFHSITSNAKEATAILKRKMKNGEIVEFAKTFTIENAKSMGLSSKEQWKNQPIQMMEARAKSFCVRNVFPDFLSGIYSKEELELDTSFNKKNEAEIENVEIETKANKEEAKVPESEIPSFELPFKAGTNYDNLAPFICKVVKLFKINELFASEKQANFMWGLCKAKDYEKLFPSLEKTINFLQSKQNLPIAHIVKIQLIELLNKSEKNNKISTEDKNNALEFLKDEFSDIRSVLGALPDILLEKILEMKTVESKQAKLVEQTNLSAFDDEIPFG